MVGAVEALEEPCQLLLVDADAVVGAAEDDVAAVPFDCERERGAWPCVADGVLGQILADHPQHPWPHLELDPRIALDGEAHAGPGRAFLQLGDGGIELGAHGDGTEGDDPAARLELGEEEHLVDQLARRLDLVARALDERVDVLARQGRHLEQRQQPCERRAQLVRDGGGEPRPQLLVGRHVADLTQVDDALSPTADLVRDDERDDSEIAGEQAPGHPLPLVDPLDRLAGPPAREQNDVGVVEDDHCLSHPLVQIRMDALGVLDFNEGTVALDATLYDSRILDFTLTGDMALRARWGDQPNFVLAIGGFHPRFPAPAGLPALRRLALTLADGDSLQLRCQAYLALTSNTVQFGARVDLHAAGGGFSFDGMLGFDALVQLAPLAFQVEVAAAIALRYRGRLLMGISFKGMLAGPTPWHVEGKATIKILFFKVSVSFERQFGSRTAPPLPAAVDVLALVTEALRDRRNWSATLPRTEPAVVTLREATPAPETLRVHPLAELTVRERVVPLNRQITKLGTAPLRGGPTTVTVRATDRSATPQTIATTPVQEPFALAQFEDLRDDELLARPAFETQEAGVAFTLETVAFEEDPTLTTTLQYETQLIDPTRPPEPARPGYVLPAAVLVRVAPFGAAGQSILRHHGRARYRNTELVA